MNQFGIHYAYWGNEWKVDMCERIRLAADAGFDDLEVTPPDFMTNLEKDSPRIWPLPTRKSVRPVLIIPSA